MTALEIYDFISNEKGFTDRTYTPAVDGCAFSLTELDENFPDTADILVGIPARADTLEIYYPSTLVTENDETSVTFIFQRDTEDIEFVTMVPTREKVCNSIKGITGKIDYSTVVPNYEIAKSTIKLDSVTPELLKKMLDCVKKYYYKALKTHMQIKATVMVGKIKSI